MLKVGSLKKEKFIISALLILPSQVMLKAGGGAVETLPMKAVAIAAQSAGRAGETGLLARVPMIFVTLFPCLNPLPRFFLAPGW